MIRCNGCEREASVTEENTQCACGGYLYRATRIPAGTKCTCSLGAPGVSDGTLHGPDCAIVRRAGKR